MPPHSRRADGTSNAPAFSLNAEASGPAGRLGVFRPKPLVPGAAPPDTKSASKNARRRSKKSRPGSEAPDAEADNDAGNQDSAAQEQTSQVEAVSNGQSFLVKTAGRCHNRTWSYHTMNATPSKCDCLVQHA